MRLSFVCPVAPGVSVISVIGVDLAINLTSALLSCIIGGYNGDTSVDAILIERPYSFRVMLTLDERDRLQQEADRRALRMTDIVRSFIRQLPENKNKDTLVIPFDPSLVVPGYVADVYVNEPGLSVPGYVADVHRVQMGE